MDTPRSSARLSRARLAAAWLLAGAPLVLGWIADSGIDRFAGVSFVALCGIPWVFVMGLPRTIGRASSFADELGGAALGLVPLAAAAGLDAAQGAEPSRTGLLVAGVVISALVLSDAARRAARSPWSARAHAIAWSALVAAPPLLHYALESGGGPFLGRAPALVAWLARASPLGGLARDVPDVTASVAPSVGGPLVLAIVAAAAAWRRRAPEAA